MPTLTRWFLKSAFLYLVGALLLGVLLAANPLFPLPDFIRFMGPVYFHLFMVGWISQMIFGVVYWMFPIVGRENPRGNELLGWLTYICLNAGLLLRVVGEPAVALRPGTGVGWVLVISAVLQWLGGLFFVLNSWQRVRERGKL
ncbi:MAG: hypothetical protein D6706_02420 [Chloroflexi bacterium]|nr:MAG: hypothetical protein D6706_02420 [Chloroflexota bacterium]